MGGRYVLETLPNLLEEALGPFNRISDLPPIPLFNVAPTQTVPIVRMADGGRELVGVRWGLVPSWSKELKGPPLINARCETVAGRPAFRVAMRGRRCLVPADGFYEWKPCDGGAKVPHLIHGKDERPFVMSASSAVRPGNFVVGFALRSDIVVHANDHQRPVRLGDVVRRICGLGRYRRI